MTLDNLLAKLPFRVNKKGVPFRAVTASLLAIISLLFFGTLIRDEADDILEIVQTYQTAIESGDSRTASELCTPKKACLNPQIIAAISLLHQNGLDGIINLHFDFDQIFIDEDGNTAEVMDTTRGDESKVVLIKINGVWKIDNAPWFRAAK